MRIKCPACGRIHEDAPRCNRCNCDLSLLLKIAETAEREVALSCLALRRGRGREALSRAKAAWRLKRSRRASRLAFLASLHLGQMDEAARWYAGARSTARSTEA